MLEEMVLADADPSVNASGDEPVLAAASRDGEVTVSDQANGRPPENTATVNSRLGHLHVQALRSSVASSLELQGSTVVVVLRCP